MEHFYGYGSWKAPIWFIAYEDGGGDLPEEVAEKFDYFSAKYPSPDQATLCNIHEVYRHLTFRGEGPRAEMFKTLYEYRFGHDAILHGVWKNLIAFTHGYRNETLPELLTYQKDSLASMQHPREALIQLYPLPSPHNHAWYYSWLDLPQCGFLKSRAQYEKYAYPSRIDTILRQIQAYKPEVVLMYGMNNINALKSSVQGSFHAAKFRMIKTIPRQIPQYHRADLGETTLLITTQLPALRHNRIETGFDWEALGRMVSPDSDG
jgi:hypothetical protein